MNKQFYSNEELTRIKREINIEIQRRGTFIWWDPLTTPTVGEDRSTPLSLPEIGKQVSVDNKTYTINNPSEGSIERTRNILYHGQQENPAGELPNILDSGPKTSGSRFDPDELRNYLIGLAKISDINLFYGRDEIQGMAFRDPDGIEKVLRAAQNSELNRLLHETDLSNERIDPVTGESISYPLEDGIYVMPSGEYNGEELFKKEGPDKTNFFDDYGAKIIDTGDKTPDGQKILWSDSDHHPINPYVSQTTIRRWMKQDSTRNSETEEYTEGGLSSSRFGVNPRNPQQGESYRSRPVFGGVLGACNVACTGLCYQTCDSECSEACTTTCWSRCGNACTTSCGNVCSGCSTMCHTSCRTKCENLNGYACLNVGAKTVTITAVGKKSGSSGQVNGINWPKNTLSFTTYTCTGCAYTCQFYPNKRTTCWDAACQELCFTSCRTYCSTTCFGGCIDNNSENKTMTSGKGRGCSSGCTINCVGDCREVCIGDCIFTCFHSCQQVCYDNCTFMCDTNCGSGCSYACRSGCTGCDLSCKNFCKEQTNMTSCIGCGWAGGCTSNCQHDCDKNCVGWGCRSICGIGDAGACEANCRMSCINQGCSSMCGQACASVCTNCVNSCGFQCGPCTSTCSIGCGSSCNIICTDRCVHSCDTNCVTSCTDVCGGCSNLCYSCVGICIGICALKCESACSSCTNLCGWWCDASCNRLCFSDCSNRCLNSCTGSCITFLMAKTNTSLPGPERPPTAEGYQYPNPQDREQERDSFRLRSIAERYFPIPEVPEWIPESDIWIEDDGTIMVILPEGLTYYINTFSTVGGVFNIDDDLNIDINESMLPPQPDSNEPVIVDGDFGTFVIVIPYNETIALNHLEMRIRKLPFGLKSTGPLLDSKNDTLIIIEKIDWDRRVDYWDGKDN